LPAGRSDGPPLREPDPGRLEGGGFWAIGPSYVPSLEPPYAAPGSEVQALKFRLGSSSGREGGTEGNDWTATVVEGPTAGSPESVGVGGAQIAGRPTLFRGQRAQPDGARCVVVGERRSCRPPAPGARTQTGTRHGRKVTTRRRPVVDTRQLWFQSPLRAESVSPAWFTTLPDRPSNRPSNQQSLGPRRRNGRARPH
jgi:hypothetical protein